MNLQANVLQIMQSKNIKAAWIAKRVGCSNQSLSYQLNRAKEMSYPLYKRIMEVCKKAGIQMHQPNEVQEISRMTMDFSSLVNGSLARLTREVARDIEDGKIDAEERARLHTVLNDMQKEIAKNIEQLNNLVG